MQKGKTFIHLYLVNLQRAFVKSVGLPLVIPVGDESIVRDYVEMIDKLILTGGQNVHPQFYREKRLLRVMITTLVRDEFELALLKEALRQNKPIMAICRGVQLVNVALVALSTKKLKVTGKALPFWDISYY